MRGVDPSLKPPSRHLRHVSQDSTQVRAHSIDNVPFSVSADGSSCFSRTNARVTSDEKEKKKGCLGLAIDANQAGRQQASGRVRYVHLP